MGLSASIWPAGAASAYQGPMTEETTPPPRPRAGNVNQLLVDLGPIAVFVVAFNVLQRIEATAANAVFIATGLFMVATLAAIVWCKWKIGRIPPVLIVVGVLVTVFGGLTLILHDENYIKIKPTFVYLFYAAAVGGSLLIKQNVWKLLFRHIFTVPDRIWDILALRWAGFFVFLAGLNEFVRLTQTTEIWVNSRILVFFPLFVVFTLLNAPLVARHMADEDEAPTPAAPEA
jgi:intracellular septation protein